jgi:WD40 repeat protein
MIATAVAITIATALVTALASVAAPAAAAAGAAITSKVISAVAAGYAAAAPIATSAANNAIKNSYAVQGEDIGNGEISSILNDTSNPSQYGSIGSENKNGPCSDDVIIGKVTSKYFYTYNNDEEQRIYPFGDVVDVVNNVMNSPKINMHGTRESHHPQLYMLNYATRYYTIRNKFVNKNAYMMPLIENVTAFPIGFELAWFFQEDDDDIRHSTFPITQQITDLSGTGLESNTKSNHVVPFRLQTDQYNGKFESYTTSIIQANRYNLAIDQIKNQKRSGGQNNDDVTSERTRSLSIYRIIPPEGYVALGSAIMQTVGFDSNINVPSIYDYICIKKEYCIPINPSKIWDSLHVETKNLVGLFTTVEPYFVPGINGTVDETSNSEPGFDYTLNTEALQVMESVQGMYDITRIDTPLYKRHIYYNVPDLRTFDSNVVIAKNYNLMKNNLFREIKDFTGKNDIYYINFPSPHTITLPPLLQNNTEQSFVIVYTGRGVDFAKSNENKYLVTEDISGIMYLQLNNNKYITSILDEQPESDVNSFYTTGDSTMVKVQNYNIIINFADADSTVTTSDISINYIDSDLSGVINTRWVNSDDEELPSITDSTEIQILMATFDYYNLETNSETNQEYFSNEASFPAAFVYTAKTMADGAYIGTTKLYAGYQYTAKGIQIAPSGTTKVFDRYTCYVKKYYNTETNKYTWGMHFYKINKLTDPLADYIFMKKYTPSGTRQYNRKCGIDLSGNFSFALDYSNNFIITDIITETSTEISTGTLILDMAMYQDRIIAGRIKDDNSRDIIVYKYNGSTWDIYPNLFSASDISYFSNCGMNIDIHKTHVVAVSPDVSGGYGGLRVYDISDNNTLSLNTTITNSISDTKFGNSVAISDNYMVVGEKEYNDIGENITTINTGSQVYSTLELSYPYVAAGCADGTVKILNVLTGVRVRDLSGIHTAAVRGLAFSYFDGRSLVSCCDNGDVALWNFTNGQLIYHLLVGNNTPVRDVRFSPDEQYVACVDSSNSKIKIFNVASGLLTRTITDPTFAFMNTLSYSPDGYTIATGETSKINV